MLASFKRRARVEAATPRKQGPDFRPSGIRAALLRQRIQARQRPRAEATRKKSDRGIRPSSRQTVYPFEQGKKLGTVAYRGTPELQLSRADDKVLDNVTFNVEGGDASPSSGPNGDGQTHPCLCDMPSARRTAGPAACNRWG